MSSVSMLIIKNQDSRESRMKNEEPMTSSSEMGLEFRSYADEAWYSVSVTAEGESVRVRYAGFPDDNDSVFHPNKFSETKKVDEFAARFRPLSVQLQDSHCSQVSAGLLLCASRHFNRDDVRFYDALLDSVVRTEHSFANGEEECLCSFVLSWLHGPNAGHLTAESIDQICRVQYRAEMDPIVAAFVKRAREKFESDSGKTKPIRSGEVSKRSKTKPSNGHNDLPSLRIGHKLSFSHHINQVTRCINWSLGDELSANWIFGHPCERSGPEVDFGGVGSQYLIVIENLEKDLTPLAMMEFIRNEVGFSAQAFVFPSLPSEFFTRGNVVLDSRAKFEKLCDFLESPHRIVVSSKGRPWVMTEKLKMHDLDQASVKTLSQNNLERGSDECKSSLKVVRLGSDQYGVAKQLSDLYKQLSDHQKKLQKRLIVEEGQIWKKHSAEKRVKI